VETTHRRGRFGLALGTIWACLLAWCPHAVALDPALDVSQYAHTAWKVRDGFTKGAIYAIAQTPDGYLWLGTQSGLVRFDGVRAIPWQPPAGEQLPSNQIDNLLIARDGTLWIATWKGLASWKDGKLTQYPEVAGQIVGPLLQDREGTIWFGTYEPAKLCGVHGGKVECYGAGRFGRAVNALYEDQNGSLWASAWTGLWRWKPGRPEHYAFPRGVTEANALIEDDSRALLLATNEGLKQLVGGKIQNYALPGVIGEFRPNNFFRSRDGSLWVGTHQGLLHLHQSKTDSFWTADGLSGDHVTSILEDGEGTVWVSTPSGLDRFREYAVQRISGSQGLNSSVNSVQATRDGSIWLVTPGGLNRWQSGHMTLYGKRSGPDPKRAKE
jgi:ligand-binding sensor domain-containing protein